MDTSHHYRGGKQLFIDVHRLEPGKVKYEAVADAHAEDLAVKEKYNVQFLKLPVYDKYHSANDPHRKSVDNYR